MTDAADGTQEAHVQIPRFKLGGECYMSRPLLGVYDALPKRTRTQILYERRAAMPTSERDRPGDWQFDAGKGTFTSPERTKPKLADGFLPIDNEKFLTKYNIRPGPVPLHSSAGDLRNERVAKLRAAGSVNFNRWCQENPAMADEPLPATQSGLEENTSASPTPNVRRMKDEIGRFRAHYGLSPSPTSPQGEMTVGYEYRLSPQYATKGEFMQERKRVNLQEIPEKRAAQDEFCVPHSVRKSRRLEEEYRAAIPDCPRQTLTKLRLDRKRERIDTEHARPIPVRCQWPLFSDQLVPWWMTGGDTTSTSPCVRRTHSDTVLDARSLVPSCSVPPVKNTEAPLIGRGKDTNTGAESLASYAKLWCINGPRARASRALPDTKHRVYGGVGKVPMYNNDFMPMEHFSSFDLLRHESKKKFNKTLKKNADKQLTSNIPPEPVEHSTPVKSAVGRSWMTKSASRLLSTDASGISASTNSPMTTTNKNLGSMLGDAVSRSQTIDVGGIVPDQTLPPKRSDDGKSYQSLHGSGSSPKIHVSSPSHHIACSFLDTKTPEILSFAVKDKLGSIRSAGFLESRSEKENKG
eukprot:GEMP01023404.1.p1 GENE.GEMP01023404.1~~GEMP01023404.1.p1  ORF type:complete len:579 (+),score=133.14 GEMP01023404.1:291-2027(+)